MEIISSLPWIIHRVHPRKGTLGWFHRKRDCLDFMTALPNPFSQIKRELRLHKEFFRIKHIEAKCGGGETQQTLVITLSRLGVAATMF